MKRRLRPLLCWLAVSLCVAAAPAVAPASPRLKPGTYEPAGPANARGLDDSELRRGLAVAATTHPGSEGGQAGTSDAAIASFLRDLQQAFTTGQPAAYLQMLAPDADRDAARSFVEANIAGRRWDRVTLREEDRAPLDAATAGDGYRLTLEALFETGDTGRLATWRIDLRRPVEGTAWRIEGQKSLSSFDNLYRLVLDGDHQFAGRNLALKAEDLELTLANGSVFVAHAGPGATGLVLIGDGEMTFSPAPASERGQIRLVSGQDVLRTGFDACYVRLNPSDLAAMLSVGGKAVAPASVPLVPDPGPVDARALRRAQLVFADDVTRSYALDLAQLSPGPWSILPSHGDVVAEIHTKRYGALTYTRSMHDAEAIAVFDREHHRYFALYPSRDQLAARGRFYSDEDGADYVATHYDVEASFTPEREWIEGRTRIVLHALAPLSTFQLRLADPLLVRSVVGDGIGRLLAVRVRGQDTVMVTLPEPLAEGASLAVTVAYGGQLPPQPADREAAAVQPRPRLPPLPPASVARYRIAPSYLYSMRRPWYAQSRREDYATATLRLTVPARYTCVASGRLVSSSNIAAPQPGGASATQFVFDTPRPLPYLACLIAEMSRVKQETVGGSLLLSVYANGNEQERGSQVAAQAADIARFYQSLLGDYPYPALTIALVEHDVPGGHSPAYLTVLDEPAPMSQLVWREDPASFPGFREFFVAHEVAHQWWGLAVGEKNYHERWLSEAFAQYFAALYAEHVHGRGAFDDMLRRMQRWALRDSSQGPVYLGARLGQLTNDGRAFRAIVYDKGALVLHMLRLQVGDEAFFRGLRLFYQRWRFRKAGSDDLRRALEEASGKRLERFFDTWIYADGLPQLKWSWRESRAPAGNAVDVTIQQAGPLFDVPVTVTIEYADHTSQDIVVAVDDRVVERRIPVRQPVRSVDINREDTVPAQISR